MKVLVLATNYPSPSDSVGLMYIHTRNLYYKDAGIDVTVLNFSSYDDYEWEGIKVICSNTYKKKKDKYDVYISHAPNIRNHYRFIKRNQCDIDKIIFFFHGHEVLMRSKVYPKPFSFVKRNIIIDCINDIYDYIKLWLWRNYFPKLSGFSYFVFVSLWMYNQFEKWTKLCKEDLKGNVLITYNGIGKNFENTKYDIEVEKKYDFITIRSYLDGSKYAVDIVVELAQKYPQYNFLLIGKGDFFKHYSKPQNITWLDEYFNHDQIISVINSARCALMPTRTDAQGLMACEIASTGMPMITSDIDVCHEIFCDFDNVEYIDNGIPYKDFENKFESLISKRVVVNDKYYFKNTVINEIELIKPGY